MHSVQLLQRKTTILLYHLVLQDTEHLLLEEQKLILLVDIWVTQVILEPTLHALLEHQY